MFDAKSIATFWRHLELAVQDGRWKALEYVDVPRRAEAAVVTGTVAEAQVSSIPRGAVEECGDGWYSWNGYKKQAWSFDEAYRLLDAEWREQQLRHAHAAEMAKRRKEQLQRLEATDARYSRGIDFKLAHPRYKRVFRGRLLEEKGVVTFVEDGTWIRAVAEVPAQIEQGARAYSTWRDARLYNAIRGEHAKARQKESVAARREALEAQLPKVPGDMGVKGKTDGEKLTYTWHGVEVDVTPRRCRPSLPDVASAWQQAKDREATPERALRKMRTKMQRRVNKALRGEQERIVVRGQGDEATAVHEAPPPSEAASRSPALAQLDDPVVLGHLREAYEFLASADLHYCCNCDEEWVVFRAEWPQAGLACAGPKAGKCETMARAGWDAASLDTRLCSRCAASTSYRIMYSAENRQHLGPRHPALSDLTWYESLLIARVHPVISVVTLTATGLLCYAGHVCN